MSKDDSLPRTLLVEGQDDRHLVQHVWRKNYNSKPPFCISDREGFDNLAQDIPTQVKIPGREVLGILADANGDAMEKWEKNNR